jgi:hypothetical protein
MTKRQDTQMVHRAAAAHKNRKRDTIKISESKNNI